MPLFYLHRRIGDERFLDPEGENFPDLAAAIADAKQSAREYLATRLLRGEAMNGDAFEIWNADDTLVAEVLFSDVFNWTS